MTAPSTTPKDLSMITKTDDFNAGRQWVRDYPEVAYHVMKKSPVDAVQASIRDYGNNLPIYNDLDKFIEGARSEAQYVDYIDFDGVF